jgi:hypothetical protein
MQSRVLMSLIFVLLLTLCIERGAFADAPTNRIVMSDGKTGFIGVGTASPQAAFDAYGNEIKVGSSGAACLRALCALPATNCNSVTAQAGEMSVLIRRSEGVPGAARGPWPLACSSFLLRAQTGARAVRNTDGQLRRHGWV